jgi:hypothetical protein
MSESMKKYKYEYDRAPWYDRYNPWSSYNMERELKERKREELSKYLIEFRKKGPINDLITTIVEKNEDYLDYSVDEIKRFILRLEKIKDPIIACELARVGPNIIKACIDEWQIENVIEISKKLMEEDIRAAIAFLKKSIELLITDRNIDIKGWAEKGMSVDEVERFDYFRGATKVSQDFLGLSKKRAVELPEVINSLRCFARIIARKPVNIEGTDKGVFTDGSKIFLPKKEDEFPTKDLNRRKLRAFTSHEARHVRESMYLDLSKVNIKELEKIIEREAQE